MKRKISCILVLCILVGTVAAIPITAYTRISYGADCLAEEAALIKSALRGDPYTFSEVDFKQALGISRLQNVTVLSLPPAKDGCLTLADKPVAKGQVLSRKELGALVFTPAGAGFEGTSFQFCVNSSAGTTALTCTLRVCDRVNYAPTTETVKEADLFVTTAKDIAVYGRMKAADPEGDPLTYLVIAYPEKGVLSLGKEGDGEFRYTPQAGMTGRDSFTYVARDSYGNYSRPTTVEISVSKRNSTLTYADMEGHRAHNAALVMAEKNIMLGTLEGDHMYFDPTGSVSRADFLVMAMKSADKAPAAGMSDTWFDDNDKIKPTVRSYVATAQLYGYVNGSFNGTGLYFNPNAPITRAEAAVIMNNILGADTPAVLPTFADSSDIPVWARDAIGTLYAAGIFDTAEDGGMDASAPLTRAQAACALYEMMQYNP